MSENPKSQPKPLMPMGPGGGGRAGMKLVEKPKNFSATMKKLVSYIKPFWVSIILVFTFAIVSTVFAILSPRILGDMTNQIVSSFTKAAQIDFGALKGFGIELLILYVLSAIFAYIQGWIMTG